MIICIMCIQYIYMYLYHHPKYINSMLRPIFYSQTYFEKVRANGASLIPVTRLPAPNGPAYKFITIYESDLRNVG